MDAVDRFGVELTGCGVAPATIARLSRRYAEALLTGERSAWERLYDDLFAGLTAVANRPAHAAVRRVLLDSVLRILEDDLGTERFGERAVFELRESLMKLHDGDHVRRTNAAFGEFLARGEIERGVDHVGL